jgi:hypothetical protein
MKILFVCHSLRFDWKKKLRNYNKTLDHQPQQALQNFVFIYLFTFFFCLQKCTWSCFALNEISAALWGKRFQLKIYLKRKCNSRVWQLSSNMTYVYENLNFQMSKYNDTLFVFRVKVHVSNNIKNKPTSR